MTLEIGAFLFLLLRPRHERTKRSEERRGEEKERIIWKTYTCTRSCPDRREKASTPRRETGSLFEGHLFPLQVWSRQRRLFDTANLVISGRQIRIPCRGGRGSARSRPSSRIDRCDATRHAFTHAHCTHGAGTKWSVATICVFEWRDPANVVTADVKISYARGESRILFLLLPVYRTIQERGNQSKRFAWEILTSWKLVLINKRTISTF